MEPKTKNITLDDLALMVARGFEAAALDLATFKADMAIFRAETKLNFQEVHTRIDRLDDKVEDLRDALQRLEEGDILNLQTRVTLLEKIVKKLNDRMLSQ